MSHMSRAPSNSIEGFLLPAALAFLWAALLDRTELTNRLQITHTPTQQCHLDFMYSSQGCQEKSSLRSVVVFSPSLGSMLLVTTYPRKQGKHLTLTLFFYPSLYLSLSYSFGTSLRRICRGVTVCEDVAKKTSV